MLSLDDAATTLGARIAVRADPADADLEHYARTLEPADRRIAESRAPARRAGFVTGRLLLRELLDADPALQGAMIPIPVCPRCGGPHGPMRASDWLSSVSHSAGTTAVVVMRTGDADQAGVSAIGLDIEAIGDAATLRERAAAVGAVTGTSDPDPRAALRRWTRIEAVLKADGRGLAVSPSSVRIDETPPVPSAHVVDRPGRRFELYELDAGPGLVATLVLGSG